MSTSVDKMISRKRAVEICGISKNSIVRLEQKGLFPPHIKVGARVFYSLTEVLEWVRQRKGERSAAWQDIAERRAHRAAEIEKLLAEAALARAQLDQLAHAPRTKVRRICQCGAAV